MNRMIYLDNNATTRPLPEVVEAMLPFLGEAYANPSSIHQFGQSVRHAVECARAQVADLIGASPKEIIFTSGGTESINTAIVGMLKGRPDCRKIVTTAVEHSAVLRVVEKLQDQGYTVEYVGVDGEGRIDEGHWDSALTDDTALATIMHANNETGTLFDVEHLTRVASDRGIPVHVDAVQTVGKVAMNVSAWPVQLVSLSAHKFHGPKGIGALYIRRRTRIDPVILGGSQERELRGGTENVAGIVGMGVAAACGKRDCTAIAKSVGMLRNALEASILERIPFASVNGGAANRIYNTTNISFAGLEAEAILIVLSEVGICASSGSACSSGSLEPSHVLKAMKIEESIAHGAIRWSLSRFNTAEEINEIVEKLPELLSRLTVLATK